MTQFFRDREAFEALQAEVIPRLFQGKGEGDQVRACVMGCATGEEAYSIAILLLEHASTLDNAPKIQIFATDIDEGSLASARKGRYPESIADHMARKRLERFFQQQDGAWQVSRELRDIVLFSSSPRRSLCLRIKSCFRCIEVRRGRRWRCWAARLTTTAAQM